MTSTSDSPLTRKGLSLVDSVSLLCYTYASDGVGFLVSTLITRTKLVVLRCPATLLKRERLIDLLFDLLARRLILVQAPAGYGKIYFAHDADMPACWYSLDTSDQDVRLFIAHSIASIAHRRQQNLSQ